MPRKYLPNAPSGQLAANVHYWREEFGWSKIRLAEELGIHVTSVSRIEHGVMIPSLDVLVRLALIFKISIDTLVRDKRPEAKTPDEIEMDNLIALVRSLRPEIRENARWVLSNLAQGRTVTRAEFSAPPKITPVLPDQSWTKPDDGT